MNSRQKHIIPAAVAVTAVCTFLMAGCRSEGGSPMGPEQVTETFVRAVASGRFDEALDHCDSVTMNGYIESYRKALAREEAKDSSSTAIATHILSEIKVSVTQVGKSKGIRTIFFTIEDAYGDRKDKVAILKNEEGEWKVTEIKDRN